MTMDAASLGSVLQILLDRHGDPGVVAGVLQDGRLVTAAAGTANLNSGIEMTPDTAFLTGSITKVWTTSLIMTFVDEGIVDLDTPIVVYDPALQFGGDPAVAAQLTLRHLLNHSSGVDAGDYVIDTGPYPDGVVRYVEKLRQVGCIHEPGKYSSYNNAGWVVAEMVLRRVAGKDFHTLLRERIIEPLGLTRTVLGADEAILSRTAIGHFPDSENGFSATPRFSLPSAFAAAGATLVTTAEDSLRFLAMHLDEGMGPVGRVLSQGSAVAMATPTIADPIGPVTGFGLGWRTTELGDGNRMIWHAGGSHGGVAMACLLPHERFGYVAFVNSSKGFGIHMELQRLLMGDFLPAPVMPPAAEPTSSSFDHLNGSYRRKSVRVDIRADGELLHVHLEAFPDEFDMVDVYRTGSPDDFTAKQVDSGAFVSTEPVFQGMPYTMHFLDPDESGTPRLLYMMNRLARRVG